MGVSFGRDYHALQVIPDRHQATVAKSVSTWNVRTMHQSGKMENVLKEMRRSSMSSESRRLDGLELGRSFLVEPLSSIPVVQQENMSVESDCSQMK